MVTLIVITAAIWVVGSLAAGVGVGRVISRADLSAEMQELVREDRGFVAH